MELKPIEIERVNPLQAVKYPWVFRKFYEKAILILLTISFAYVIIRILLTGFW